MITHHRGGGASLRHRHPAVAGSRGRPVTKERIMTQGNQRAVASRPCERQTDICKPCPCVFHCGMWRGDPITLSGIERQMEAVSRPRSPRHECRGPGWAMAGSGRSVGPFLSSAVVWLVILSLHGTKSHVNGRSGCRFGRSQCRIPSRVFLAISSSAGSLLLEMGLEMGNRRAGEPFRWV